MRKTIYILILFAAIAFACEKNDSTAPKNSKVQSTKPATASTGPKQSQTEPIKKAESSETKSKTLINTKGNTKIDEQTHKTSRRSTSIEPKRSNAKPSTKNYDGPAETMPMMLEFTRAFCMPCHVMKPWVEKLKETYAGKLDVAEINLDLRENENLARYFRVNGVPTQVYVDKNGTVVATHLGLAQYHQMEQMVESKLGIKKPSESKRKKK